MVVFLIGPGLIIAAAVVFMHPGKDPATGEARRNWPLIWLLVWLGIFFLRAYILIVRFLLSIIPMGRVMTLGMSAIQKRGATPAREVFYQSVIILIVAIVGYRLLRRYRSKIPG